MGILTDSGSGFELERVHLPESQVSETIRPTTLLLIGPLKTDLNPHTGGMMAGRFWEATPKSGTGEN